MVRRPYAAAGDRSYLGVLGHHQWPMVPEVIYTDNYLQCKAKKEKKRKTEHMRQHLGQKSVKLKVQELILLLITLEYKYSKPYLLSWELLHVSTQ
jgi:hypothetical protein